MMKLCAMVCMICGMAVAADVSNPLACRLSSYGKYEEAAWTHLPSIGVHYVFLSVPAPDLMRVLSDGQTEFLSRVDHQLKPYIDAIVERLEFHRLTPLVIRGQTDLSKPSCVDELAAQLAICEKMGVKYMFLSPKHGDAPKSVAIENLRKAGDIAKQHGVTITLETHPDLGTNGDVHLKTMKAINHPNVRVNFDTGNITYYNKGADAVAELKKIIDYVGTVEFKDHSGEAETWDFPTLGQGKVNFPGIMQVLKEHGYTGPVTLEFEGKKGVDLTEADTKKAIADSIAYIQRLGVFK